MQHMLKPVLKVYTDSTEKCRLLAAELVQYLLNTHKPETELYLPYLIPVLTLRMAQKDIVEPAEELRALMMQQLEDTISLAKADLGVYIDEVIQVRGCRALLTVAPVCVCVFQRLTHTRTFPCYPDSCPCAARPLSRGQAPGLSLHWYVSGSFSL